MMPDGAHYPYVAVDIDPELTCIVGANEAGKSQLLRAIECALGTHQVMPADFCRYSTYFTVSGEMRAPDFGLEFDQLTESEAGEVGRLINNDDPPAISSFKFFRTGSGEAFIYFDGTSLELGNINDLTRLLPSVFRIDPKLAIPDSVPISYLASGKKDDFSQIGLRRPDRWPIVDAVYSNAQTLLEQIGNPGAIGETVAGAIGDIGAPTRLSSVEQSAYEGQLKLAYDLLITVGGIKTESFTQLQDALRSGDEGHVSGIVALMNADLESSLNLAKWWSQDPQFRLAIDVHDYDIVFTIRDRTGSQYSFRERSSGLKYFLSYLVQVQVRQRGQNSAELLLMDEPDAYLSNQGQQDLLRILQEYAQPSESRHRTQVVFVTHSPFLIDKNHSHRIRVLDKGVGDEGVRVVRDVGRNHFEPLRTSLGGFVGETAFIGNCNLMLEGDADQAFIAGMSRILIKRNDVAFTDRLDLNDVTLVNSGGASQLPYMVFLARGRDEDKPAVIVLLDGDQEGEQAAKQLSGRGRYKKQLVKDEYVSLLTSEIPGVSSERPGSRFEIEDLVPVAIAAAAVRNYLSELSIQVPEEAIDADTIRNSLSTELGILDAVRHQLKEHEIEIGLNKLGFARHAISVCDQKSEGDVDAKEMRDRFAALFRHLTAKQRGAQRDRERNSIASRVDRELQRFLRDKLETATKADVAVLLERIEAHIDLSVEGDAIAAAIRRLRDEYKLHSGLFERIQETESLKQKLEQLKYSEREASQSQ